MNKNINIGESVVEEEIEGEQEENVAGGDGTKSKAMQSTTEAVTNEAEDEAVVEEEITEKKKIRQYVDECYEDRDKRREDLEMTFDDIAGLVDRYQTASYDLGMVAGRQMSITSGEFIVHHIEKEIMEFIDEQIAVLPDPDLKKKKAKPEEVAMIRVMLHTWLEENMDVIVPEVEEVEEEEEPIPDVVVVHAVPGIGPPVSDGTMHEFTEYANDVSRVQADVFMPRNIRHFMCPPLEQYVDHVYDEQKDHKEGSPHHYKRDISTE